jgi:hypothetical protein
MDSRFNDKFLCGIMYCELGDDRVNPNSLTISNQHRNRNENGKN